MTMNRPIVALMMSRDEEDIIDDVITSWKRRDIPVLAIDASSDRTFEILSSYDHVQAFRQEAFFPRKGQRATDWVLNPLLDIMRRKFGPALLDAHRPCGRNLVSLSAKNRRCDGRRGSGTSSGQNVQPSPAHH